MAQSKYIPQRYMKMPVNPVDNEAEIRILFTAATLRVALSLRSLMYAVALAKSEG